MSQLKEYMLRVAIERYQTILPCGGFTTFEECFTVEEDSLFFWFNTADRSTHLLCEKID